MPPTRSPISVPAGTPIVQYANDSPAQTLEYYLPPRTSPTTPMVVYVHGGAWVGGSRTLYRFLVDPLLAQGFAVALVDYRLSNSKGNSYPTHAQDVAKAIGYLARNAVNAGYSPDQFVIIGHSAGAHIAATLATSDFLLKEGVEPNKAIRGFVGIEGIYDLPSLIGRNPSYVQLFANTAFGPNQSDWESASPIRKPLFTKSPWLVIHSTEDQLVDLTQARSFAEHLAKSGVPVKLDDHQRGSHDDVVLSMAHADREPMASILDFIQTNTKSGPASTRD